MCHMYLNLFCAFGRPQVGPPNVISNANNENHEKNIPSVMYNIFHDGMQALKYLLQGPSDKMSGDVEFGSDICPMTFSSFLTRK